MTLLSFDFFSSKTIEDKKRLNKNWYDNCKRKYDRDDFQEIIPLYSPRIALENKRKTKKNIIDDTFDNLMDIDIN